MKIVADENIPYAQELFGPLGELVLTEGRSLAATDVAGADILLVRSVTRVDAELLRRAAVRFVGTCTIGVDHLATDYLRRRGIAYASAPGCNADAVAQYVVSVLARLDLIASRRSVVVIGGGNVGSRVYRMLAALGFSCRCVDPYLDASSQLRLVDFSAVFAADIVCLHTPLTRIGDYPTAGMFGATELECLKPGAVLINAGRGGVIDESALLSVLDAGRDLRVVLDVWENEPAINPTLLRKVILGTPHIAGYSHEGRVRGALMIFDALCRHLGVGAREAQGIRATVTRRALARRGQLDFSNLADAVTRVYDVAKDARSLLDGAEGLPASFDNLRKHYPRRREFGHYRCREVPAAHRSAMAALGFGVDG